MKLCSGETIKRFIKSTCWEDLVLKFTGHGAKANLKKNQIERLIKLKEHCTTSLRDEICSDKLSFEKGIVGRYSTYLATSATMVG